MFGNLLRDTLLSVQSRTGITMAFVVWCGIIAIAGLSAFAFLCVAGYEWLSVQAGGIYAGLIMAAETGSLDGQSVLRHRRCWPARDRSRHGSGRGYEPGADRQPCRIRER